MQPPNLRRWREKWLALIVGILSFFTTASVLRPSQSFHRDEIKPVSAT